MVNADANGVPFEDWRFTGAVSFTMLHHVPTAVLQDRLFAEVARVLRPGALFVASDSVASDELEALHDGDPYNPDRPRRRRGPPGGGRLHGGRCPLQDFGWAAHAVR